MSDEPQQQNGGPDPRGWTPRELPADADAPRTEQGPPAGGGKKTGKKAKRPKRTGWRRAVPTWRMVLGGILLIALVLIGGFIAGYQLVDILSLIHI